jgi:hypothetical protein
MLHRLSPFPQYVTICVALTFKALRHQSRPSRTRAVPEERKRLMEVRVQPGPVHLCHIEPCNAPVSTLEHVCWETERDVNLDRHD